MTQSITRENLEHWIQHAAAVRRRTYYQPAGGEGDKIFPATYEGGKYALEERRFGDELVPCVLIDSVQSQANRFELALREAWEAGELELPVVRVDFIAEGLPDAGVVTSLDAPHRIADAILRDSLLGGIPFRSSELGKQLDSISVQNATPVLDLCPTALLFGMWDSTGPKGGSGAKVQRGIVSEIIGLHAQLGVKTSSRIDPLGIRLQAGPLYHATDGGWTRDEQAAKRSGKTPLKLGKDGKPSEANHGNVTPSISEGGVTITKALQTTVISLAALRRLRFPFDGVRNAAQELAARTFLVSLGLCASTLDAAEGCDLRSRCQLVPTEALTWEVVGGSESTMFTLDRDAALALYGDCVAALKRSGLPWRVDPIDLKPTKQLLDLVRRSQELAAGEATGI